MLLKQLNQSCHQMLPMSGTIIAGRCDTTISFNNIYSDTYIRHMS